MKNLTTNWHLVRVLQLAMGLMLTGSYLFYRTDALTLAFGMVLLLQAALNINCLAGACAVPPQQNRRSEKVKAERAEEVTYEEY